jgi:glycosyltransferase 2 family protein
LGEASDQTRTGVSSAKTRTRVILIAINLVTIAFLAWSLRNFKLAEFVDDLATTNWWWVAFAIIGDIGVYTLQALRWKLLLHPVEPASLKQTLRAIYVGQFGNEALGFNAGEIVRCYLITRWTSLPFSVSISSALIERIFDGVWLSACLFLALRIVPHPAHMRLLIGSEYVLVGFVILGASLLAIALFHKQRAHAALSGKNWQRHLRVLIDDLSLIGHSRYLYFAFFLSLGFLLLQAVPIYATFRGYGFEGLALTDALAMMVILRLGSAVPQAPGNIGFYLLSKEILQRIFNVEPSEADHFSMLLWGIVMIRMVIGGAVALTITGAGFGELRKAAHAHHDELTKSRE